ncbi:FtsX-like permease family protein [Microbulbifer mangrovi]|uniref:FtsX-like permease family protein n=1 Tax=Microbulbifer mangrovi TaxID=927787 RepID=UPI0009904547|nr:FtsX-like permease family protein [Microbulbifer mangrovi]
MGLAGVFLSHYRRHPGQLLGLLLILLCAAMLWSGVRSLTGSAENAVAKSTTALEPLLSVVRTDGEPLAVDDFVRLRRSGLCVSPRLEVRVAANDAPAVIGIDPFSAACLRQYRQSPDEEAADRELPIVGQLLSALDRPLLLGSARDIARWRQLSLSDSLRFELGEVDGLPRGQLLTDIAVASEVASLVPSNSRLQILLPAMGTQTNQLPLPEGYLGQVEDYGVQPDPLVNAFLLSLDALGALALLVAALLVRSVYRFALEQRRRSLEILVRVGVPRSMLRVALIAEVLLVALIGGTLGVWLGERLASAMADGFQGTLSGLFNVDTLGKSAATAETWLGMVLILAVVVSWACLDLLMLRQEPRHGPLSSGAGASSGSRGRWRWLGALLLFFAVSLLVLLATDTLWLVFVSATGCLLGVGLLLPDVLNHLFARAECHYAQGHNTQPLLEWSCSEMRALCRLLSLPLTALAFAIATAIGVQAMVNGFESTFARWLDQRLQGDLYLDPGQPVTTSEWSARLEQLHGVTMVLPMVRGRALLQQGGSVDALPVDVLAIDPASPLLQDWPFKDAVPYLWSELPARGVLINEQLSRRQSLAVGDHIRFRIGAELHVREVLGIYADYGRPDGELMLSLTLVPDSLPNRYSTFVLGASDTRKIRWREWPEKNAWMAGSRLRDQAGLKQAANAAFARTFHMTQLLNGLTLGLAGTALTLMGLVIFRMRQGSYTLLHVYGVQQKQLRRRMIAHSMLVTGLLALFAIPLGIFLGWVLVARVNPAAFGWALPLYFYPGFWLQVWLVCLLIGALVGVLVGNPVRLETLKHE